MTQGPLNKFNDFDNFFEEQILYEYYSKPNGTERLTHVPTRSFFMQIR